MCLLIVNPERREIPLEVLETASDNNPDGFGCAYSKAGKVVVRKSSGLAPGGFDKFCRLVSRQRPEILHFRWATHGSVCKKLCHPFAGSGGGQDWALAHNGILKFAEELPEGHSDTSFLANALQGCNPRDFLNELAEICGNGNKLGFVFADGSTEIVGEDQGDWVDGVWYSNESGFWSAFGFAKPAKKTLGVLHDWDRLTDMDLAEMDPCRRSEAVDEYFYDWKQGGW